MSLLVAETRKAVELLKFKEALTKYDTTITMTSKDGSEHTHLVPKDALPHVLSYTYLKMKRTNQMDSTMFHYVIPEIQTTESALQRYAQCVGMKRTLLPIFDFDYTDGGSIKSPIFWTLTDLVDLYILSSTFGNANFCDMILDIWALAMKKLFENNFAPTEAFEGYLGPGLHLLPSPQSPSSFDVLIPATFGSIMTEEMAALYRYTNDGHPGRLFWLNLLAAADQSMTALGQEKALTRFWNYFYAERCKRYHLHSKIDEQCWVVPAGTRAFHVPMVPSTAPDVSDARLEKILLCELAEYRARLQAFKQAGNVSDEQEGYYLQGWDLGWKERLEKLRNVGPDRMWGPG